MTPREKAQIKSIMEEKLAEAKGDIYGLTEATQSIAPDNAIGRVSRMDAIGNKAVNDMALEKAKNKIEHLEYALSLYGTIEFGVCTECYQDISFKRLSAMPEVETCMNCAAR
ncbi:MAG: TraR/DksA C4-type zinc finger protein [Lentisphaeraceae bacterium]|nr:TraR/DksA C4-type zinc finger protein [Lentisphaeraceae bacterium]